MVPLTMQSHCIGVDSSPTQPLLKWVGRKLRIEPSASIWSGGCSTRPGVSRFADGAQRRVHSRDGQQEGAIAPTVISVMPMYPVAAVTSRNAAPAQTSSATLERNGFQP